MKKDEIRLIKYEMVVDKINKIWDGGWDKMNKIWDGGR